VEPPEGDTVASRSTLNTHRYSLRLSHSFTISNNILYFRKVDLSSALRLIQRHQDAHHLFAFASRRVRKLLQVPRDSASSLERKQTPSLSTPRSTISTCSPTSATLRPQTRWQFAKPRMAAKWPCPHYSPATVTSPPVRCSRSITSGSPYVP
jgi:hypothetical protein